MVAMKMFVAVVVLGLSLLSVAFAASVPNVEFTELRTTEPTQRELGSKPNNYPNFEFQESNSGVKTETAEVSPHNYQNFEFSASSAGKSFTKMEPSVPEYKPNNYPDFEFTESTSRSRSSQLRGRDNLNSDKFDQQRFSEMPDAKDRFPSHNSQKDYLYTEKVPVHGTENSESTFSKPGTESFSTELPSQGRFSTGQYATRTFNSHENNGVTFHRGSDASGRNPDSFDLINSQSPPKRFQGTENEQFKAYHHQAKPQSRSTQYYGPATDPDYVFRFAQPNTHAMGANQYKVDNDADDKVYSQFNFDNSDATNDPSATYGSTAPVTKTKRIATVGSGCANTYWAEHVSEWPSFFKIYTTVVQAFGTRAGDIYGTTTLLQALYDNRRDGYSQLLSHGVAAMLNAYTKSNYKYRHTAVIQQFDHALVSRSAAGVQAAKFEMANKAYGPDECKN